VVLRTAALYDRDPRGHEPAAEVLALRGVHPTVDSARSALLAVADVPMREKPAARRRWRTWVRGVYELLILGGFLSALPINARGRSCAAEDRDRSAGRAGGLGGPPRCSALSFMITMAWGCGSSARELGRRSLTFYDTEADSAQAAIAAAKQQREAGLTQAPDPARQLLVLPVAIPIAFIAFVVQEHQTLGITPATAVGALVALSLVIATTVIATRR